MQSSKTAVSHVPKSIYENLTQLYKNGISKNNFKEALVIAPAMIIFGAMWLPLFLAVYFLFYLIESHHAVYVLGSLDNMPSAILPSFICGATMIYFNSKFFYKLFFRKNYQKLIDLDNASNRRSTKKFMKVFTALLIAGSIVFLGLTAHQNIKLTETGIYDNTKFFSIYGTYYSYQEIEKVYYRDKTPSGYGNMLDIPSYVIMLKNGEEIDPYMLNTCNEKFLNALKNKGVYIDSFGKSD